MHHLFHLLLVLSSVIAAHAHLGNENNTEVRVFSDKMRVVLRTSIPFAWKLMDDRAPAMADEAGQAIARPLLIAAAPGLITVTAGGKPMIPTEVDCMFEVEKDVAFILNFKRPAEWPVVVDAGFFSRFDSLETGTITVFDYSASRFSRDLDPVVHKVIGPGNSSVSFSLGGPVLTPKPEEESAIQPATPSPTLPAVTPWTTIFAISLLLLSVLGIGFLAWRRLSDA